MPDSFPKSDTLPLFSALDGEEDRSAALAEESRNGPAGPQPITNLVHADHAGVGGRPDETSSALVPAVGEIDTSNEVGQAAPVAEASVESSHEAQADKFDKFDPDHEAAVARIRKVRHDAKIAARRTSKSAARHSGMPPPRSDHGVPNYFTVRELAVRFRVSIATIWRWTKEYPAFPKPVKIGGSTRWRRADIEAYELALGTL
jgi:predicted DNA-binding transcriptional regulator AlpA